MQRRDVLTSRVALAAATVSTSAVTQAEVISKELPWEPGAANAPQPARKSGLLYLTPAEALVLGAIADRLIPADELSIGGKDAGCVEFIDRQLDGSYGKAISLYRLGPFYQGTDAQGPQLQHTPAERYRLGLAALAGYTHKQHGKPFDALDAATQDKILVAMESNTLALGPVDGKALFELVLQNVREGFLSDPLYGGNKGMASWKMLGFPGARYDFRDHMDKKGQKLVFMPTSMVDNSL